ncbi:MAG: type restriction enzyme subunit [Clostridiales bacterium]|nr:type restriction enzyme subunit [Clostridiales bacterium]
MESEWNEVIFSEVIEINPNRELIKGQEYPFIDMQAVEPYTRKISNIKFRKYNGSGSKFKNGDTLFARITPCLENGKTAYVKELKSGETGFGSTEFLVFSGKEDVTDNLFVYYLSRSSEIREYAIKNMTGTSGRQRVDKSCFNELKIKLPSLPEQQKIASILSAFDDKIELNNEMNKTLEEIAQAIFKHWFIDFEFPNENGEPYKSNGGEFVDSELGPIPKGWEVRKLGEIGQFKNGINYGREESGDSKYKIVNVRDLVTTDYIIPSRLDTINIDKRKANQYLLEEGDLLIVRSANPGEIGINMNSDSNLIYSSFIIRFRLYDRLELFYLYFLLKNIKQKLEIYSNGTTLKNINQQILNGIKVMMFFARENSPFLQRFFPRHRWGIFLLT